MDITWISHGYHVFICLSPVNHGAMFRIGSSQAQAEYFQEQQMRLGERVHVDDDKNHGWLLIRWHFMGVKLVMITYIYKYIICIY
jgi:hypothetical protein